MVPRTVGLPEFGSVAIASGVLVLFQLLFRGGVPAVFWLSVLLCSDVSITVVGGVLLVCPRSGPSSFLVATGLLVLWRCLTGVPVVCMRCAGAVLLLISRWHLADGVLVLQCGVPVAVLGGVPVSASRGAFFAGVPLCSCS